jgi:uncharacterized RDD family membrane protein YckC
MVQSQIELAGRRRRLAAAIIDGVMIGLSNWAIFRNGTESPGAISVASGLIYFVYYSIQHGMWGQTLGKRVCGIKVVSVDFDEIGWGAAIWRTGFQSILSLVTLGVGWLIDVAWILWDVDGQALHDKVARTWVVEAEHGDADPYRDVPVPRQAS